MYIAMTKHHEQGKEEKVHCDHNFRQWVRKFYFGEHGIQVYRHGARTIAEGLHCNHKSEQEREKEGDNWEWHGLLKLQSLSLVTHVF